MMTKSVTEHPTSADAIWHGLLIEMLTHGTAVESRDGDTYEIVGSGVRLSPYWSYLELPERRLDPSYAMAELLWYLSGVASVNMIQAYAPQYARFAEEDGEVYGAYGPRVRNALPDVIEELTLRPASRRCVMPMFQLSDLRASGQKKDLPCTVGWQFLQRHGVLHMVTFMRSNDLWLGWPYDVHVNCCVLQLVAAHLGFSVGWYTHLVSSLHLYARDVKRAKECAWESPAGATSYKKWEHKPGFDLFEDADVAVSLEMMARSLKADPKTDPRDILAGVCSLKSELLADAVLCCASRWLSSPELRARIQSNVLRKAVEDADRRRS